MIWAHLEVAIQLVCNLSCLVLCEPSAGHVGFWGRPLELVLILLEPLLGARDDIGGGGTGLLDRLGDGHALADVGGGARRELPAASDGARGLGAGGEASGTSGGRGSGRRGGSGRHRGGALHGGSAHRGGALHGGVSHGRGSHGFHGGRDSSSILKGLVERNRLKRVSN